MTYIIKDNIFVSCVFEILLMGGSILAQTEQSQDTFLNFFCQL